MPTSIPRCLCTKGRKLCPFPQCYTKFGGHPTQTIVSCEVVCHPTLIQEFEKSNEAKRRPLLRRRVSASPLAPPAAQTRPVRTRRVFVAPRPLAARWRPGQAVRRGRWDPRSTLGGLFSYRDGTLSGRSAPLPPSRPGGATLIRHRAKTAAALIDTHRQTRTAKGPVKSTKTHTLAETSHYRL